MQRPLAITIVASLIIAIGALSFLSVISSPSTVPC